MVLVTVGTVSQKYVGLYASQQKYFSSYFFLFGPLPLPGGRIVLSLMLVNLISMLFKQNLWKMKKIGVIVVHLGGIMLLVGAGLTAIFSTEGSMVIEEGSKSNTVDDYHITELAIINISDQTNNTCLPNMEPFCTPRGTYKSHKSQKVPPKDALVTPSEKRFEI